MAARSLLLGVLFAQILPLWCDSTVASVATRPVTIPADGFELLHFALGLDGSDATLQRGSSMSTAEKHALGLVSVAVNAATHTGASLEKSLGNGGAKAAPGGNGKPVQPGSPRVRSRVSPPSRTVYMPQRADQRLAHDQRRRTQLQSGAGSVVGSCVNDSDTSDNTASNFEVMVEVDESSDLNLLVAHVAKILLQDKMGFNVQLVPRHDTDHSINRIAGGAVHANFEVGLEEHHDYMLYRELVEKDELILDLGATGYSTTSGLFVANGNSLSAVMAANEDADTCLFPDYWQSFTHPAVLAELVSVHDVLPGIENGSTVCNASMPGQGFCSSQSPQHAGKYYSTSACDANGYSIRDPSFSCRALIAHYPRYQAAVLEQLVNNLGQRGFEFGVIWLGTNASAHISQLAAAGKVFMFHHWYPSTMLAESSHLYSRLDLPTHDRSQWMSAEAVLPTGPIRTSFLPTAGLKLLKSTIATHKETVNGTVDATGALLKEFMQKFSLLEEHVDGLLAMSHDTELAINFTCTGTDDSESCQTLHEQIACGWVQQNQIVWDVFLPAHKHCNAGEHVDVTAELDARCVVCELGRFMDHTSNLHQCEECPPGKYADSTGRDGCTSCAAGRFGTDAGAVSPTLCEECHEGQFQSHAGRTKCTDCEPGEFQAATGKSYCHSCSTGEYQQLPGATSCETCLASARSCAVVLLPEIRVECKYRQNSPDSCTCNPGTFRNSSNACAPCPEGAFCCMCPEVAGCYNASFGECNHTLLAANVRRCNSTCCDGAVDGELFTRSDPPSCVSGVPRPIAMPGYYEVKTTSSVSNISEQAAITSSSSVSTYLGTSDDVNSTAVSTVFWACSLVLPSTKLRTAVDWDYLGCLGAASIQNDTCAIGNSGHLCADACPPDWYRVQLGRCKECTDPAGARTLVLTLFAVGFFIVIPVLFNVIYFSISDKSAAQYMVYTRLIIDLIVVLYLIYSSLFRYWPSHLLAGFWRKDGESQLEKWDSLTYGMECGFNWTGHVGFEKRYYMYLLLPFILIIGLSVQIGLVWFIYTYDNTELLIDGGESPEQLCWKQMLLSMSSSERKAALTKQRRAEDLVKEPSQLERDEYAELVLRAQKQAEAVASLAAVHGEAVAEQRAAADLAGLEVSDELARKRRDESPRGNCLNTLARSLGSCLPDSRSPMGPRIAWAPPRDGDSWDRFMNHSTQVYVFLLVLLYISLVNYALTVFACSSFNPSLNGTDDKQWHMEWEPTIQCFTWDDPVWPRVAIIGGCLGGFYTVMIPGGLLMAFMANKDAAQRGDMRYMQRFGFLLKPYKPEAYYWEIVNMSRKAFLSFIIKIFASTPFMCGAYALGVLCVIIANQAHVRPYKYEKHNTCAIWVLTLGVLNFFSSLIFITDVASTPEKRVLMTVNALSAAVMVLWTFGGALKDVQMYLRLQWFAFKCELSGRSAIENETMWLVVDKPGVISLKWYDTIVMRNRYSHMVARASRLSLDGEVGEKGTKEKLEFSWISEARRVQTRLALDDQNAAHVQWLRFHENFARFVAQIDAQRISPNFREELAQRDKESKSAAQIFMEMDEDGSGSLEMPEVTELCYRLNPKLKLSKKDLEMKMQEMDEDGNGEVDLQEFVQWWSRQGFASTEDSNPDPNDNDDARAGDTARVGDDEPARRGFKHLEPVAMLLEQLYTTRNLAKMVLYMEHAIKNGLEDQCELRNIGPSDIASHLIQFTREFAEDIVGASSYEVSADSHLAWGSPRASDSTDGPAGVEKHIGGGDVKFESDKRYLLMRPHRSLGIDMFDFHRSGKAVCRHPNHARTATTARDFANPLHALNFELQDNASTLQQVSAMLR